MENSFSEVFADAFTMPPVDVIIGLICVLLFGITLGFLLYFPVAHKASKLPLEKLSNELIWRYTPDWLILIIGCIISLIVSFLLVSGYWREL